MPHPGLLHPEPLPLWQATADPYLLGRHSKAGLAQFLWGLLMCTGLFEPSEHLWQEWCLILNVVSPLLPSCCNFSFALGHAVSFLVRTNILLLMVVQQRVVILEFSQEKMSTRPSTSPSCKRMWLMNNSNLFLPVLESGSQIAA